MTAQPRHPGQHMAGQMRRARVLRQEAAGIADEIHSIAVQLFPRAERYGWTDHAVEEGLAIIGRLEAHYHALLTEAKRFDGLMIDIGA